MQLSIEIELVTRAVAIIHFVVFSCAAPYLNLNLDNKLQKTADWGFQSSDYLRKIKREAIIEENAEVRGRRSTEENTFLISYGLIKKAVTKPGEAAYLGCFSTSDQWSVETAHMTSARGREAGRDVPACIEDCWEQRTRFALIGRRANCVCGGLLAMMTMEDTALCQAPCVNNASLACGGTTAFDVYYSGYIEEPFFDIIAYDDIPKVYQGCYEDKDSTYATLCPFSFLTTRLNVQMCMEICSNNWFKYAALDSPQRCCCSETVDGAYLTKPGKCNLQCKTGRGFRESCGGGEGFLSVYSTGTPEVVQFKPKRPQYPWMQPNVDDGILRAL